MSLIIAIKNSFDAFITTINFVFNLANCGNLYYLASEYTATLDPHM